jgi:very-short-patch-repair endonuclease
MQYNRKSKKLLPLARANRKHPTDAERKLWYLLKDEKLGFKFRRQHRIGAYIVDFICLEKNLVIECDGGQHAGNKADEERTNFLT